MDRTLKPLRDALGVLTNGGPVSTAGDRKTTVKPRRIFAIFTLSESHYRMALRMPFSRPFKKWKSGHCVQQPFGAHDRPTDRPTCRVVNGKRMKKAERTYRYFFVIIILRLCFLVFRRLRDHNDDGVARGRACLAPRVRRRRRYDGHRRPIERECRARLGVRP